MTNYFSANSAFVSADAGQPGTVLA